MDRSTLGKVLVPIALGALTLPGCASDDLGGAVGRWECIGHHPTQNSTTFADSAFSDIGWTLFVDATAPDEGRAHICGGPLALNCIDYLDGPLSYVDDLLVWRLDFRAEAFDDPHYDCTLHEVFRAVLLPEGNRMTLISDAEHVEFTGSECDQAEAWAQSLEGSKPDNPLRGADITQYNELVRR